jgi:poly(A) polymerase
VGGGVRDLLLGREPKDFDVVTDARPEQIKDLFRNCRLIGRRFRLAHVRFGREIIEVATFRANAGEVAEGEHLNADGRLVRDNVYGTMEEDAWRRDFSVNGLYYDIRDFSLVDITGGMPDLETGILRVLGDPVQRYREDPVRMLRAVRFAAKLGFRIHPDSEAPIGELAHLLADVPPARLFEEVLKLFQGGAALQTFELLRHYGLFGQLFPDTEACLAQEEEGFPRLLVARAMANTDLRIAEGKPVTPGFLFAALLWEPMRRAADQLRPDSPSEIVAFEQASAQTFSRQAQRVSIPRRFSYMAQDIWTMQPRLVARRGRRAEQLLGNPRFRAAYDFLLLRAECGEDVETHARWWTEFQEADENQRKSMVDKGPRSRRRRRRAKKPDLTSAT